MDFTDVRSKSSVLHVFPFNSEKKRGGVAVQVINTFVSKIIDISKSLNLMSHWQVSYGIRSICSDYSIRGVFLALMSFNMQRSRI
jgi:Ca2+-transporting ATPase